jgi:hypothetical protein
VAGTSDWTAGRSSRGTADNRIARLSAMPAIPPSMTRKRRRAGSASDACDVPPRVFIVGEHSTGSSRQGSRAPDFSRWNPPSECRRHPVHGTAAPGARALFAIAKCWRHGRRPGDAR